MSVPLIIFVLLAFVIQAQCQTPLGIIQITKTTGATLCIADIAVFDLDGVEVMPFNAQALSTFAPYQPGWAIDDTGSMWHSNQPPTWLTVQVPLTGAAIGRVRVTTRGDDTYSSWIEGSTLEVYAGSTVDTDLLWSATYPDVADSVKYYDFMVPRGFLRITKSVPFPLCIADIAVYDVDGVEVAPFNAQALNSHAPHQPGWAIDDNGESFSHSSAYPTWLSVQIPIGGADIGRVRVTTRGAPYSSWIEGSTLEVYAGSTVDTDLLWFTEYPNVEASVQYYDFLVPDPTGQPSGQPTGQPTREPSGQPSTQPSGQPSSQPSSQPSTQPSRQPSSQPSGIPSAQPTGQPSMRPTAQPSRQPSSQPSGIPSAQPTGRPSRHPSGQPTSQPSGQPSGQPTSQPTGEPTEEPRPTGQPTSTPSGQPSSSPTSVMCNVGEYKHIDSIMGASCKKCPKGKYNPTAAGYAVCLECPTGGHCDVPGMDYVIWCGRGTYNPEKGATSGQACVYCPAGRYAPECGTSSLASCIPAPAGYYVAVEGRWMTYECAPGTYSAYIGASICSKCIPGKYADNLASTKCSNCPVGSVSKEMATKCTQCKAGTRAAGRICEPCKPGTYASVGSSECFYCANGYISAAFASICTPCKAGSFSLNNECVECPAGTFSAQGVHICSKCPQGSVADGAAESCKICEAGEFAVDNRKCLQCHGGTYSTKGSTECTPCPPYISASKPSSSACFICSIHNK